MYLFWPGGVLFLVWWGVVPLPGEVMQVRL